MTYRQAIEAAKRQPNWTPCVKTWGPVTTVVASQRKMKLNLLRFILNSVL